MERPAALEIPVGTFMSADATDAISFQRPRIMYWYSDMAMFKK